MSDLTIITLCRALANITHNRCVLVENSNTCRCFDDILGSKPTAVVNATHEIMLSEVFLIFFVLALWLSAIGFCLNQYKSLRRLETQVHYCVSRKDPLNIGDIKIVAREQDSIIYKKKRYSTVLDTHIGDGNLKAMQYVKEYLPKTTIAMPSSTLAALVVNREDLTSNIPLSIATTTTSLHNSSGLLPTSPFIPMSTHNELVEEQQQSPPAAPPSVTSFVLFEKYINKPNGRMSYIHQIGPGRLSTGLTVPNTSTLNSLRSSWNASRIYDTSCSTQHLCVPSNSLRSTRHSDGNITLSVPQTAQKISENPNEQLLDPRLIPNTVRRSLLALHRESQENIHMHRTKEKTQSENDVNGAFTSWKIKMKSKLKRTHHRQYNHNQSQASIRPHSNTVSILPTPYPYNDRERRISEYATMNHEYRFSTPPLHNDSLLTNPLFRRSLKHYPKHLTQSTTESETTQGDLPIITSIYISADDDESTKTILETDGQSPLTSL